MLGRRKTLDTTTFVRAACAGDLAVLEASRNVLQSIATAEDSCGAEGPGIAGPSAADRV